MESMEDFFVVGEKRTQVLIWLFPSEGRKVNVDSGTMAYGPAVRGELSNMLTPHPLIFHHLDLYEAKRGDRWAKEDPLHGLTRGCCVMLWR